MFKFHKKTESYESQNKEIYTPRPLPKFAEKGHTDLSSFITQEYSLLDTTYLKQKFEDCQNFLNSLIHTSDPFTLGSTLDGFVDSQINFERNLFHKECTYHEISAANINKARTVRRTELNDRVSTLNQEIAQTREELQYMIELGKWGELIREIPVKKGDFIQIDPGTVHAIKGGLMILETQQNSDITYRVYDYDRLTDGKPRQLHVKQSIDVITVPAPSAEDSVKYVNDLPKNVMNELISCDYYTVWKLDVTEPVYIKQDQPFMNMSVIEGEGLVNGQMIKKGDHFILPAGIGEVHLRGNMKIIASSVK